MLINTDFNESHNSSEFLEVEDKFMFGQCWLNVVMVILDKILNNWNGIQVIKEDDRTVRNGGLVGS